MTIYRGSQVSWLNSQEFLDGSISGKAYPIIEVDFPETEQLSDYKYQDISTFDRFIEDRYDVWVTGGMTPSLPAALKFTKHQFPPGVVLHMDEGRIDAPTEPVQYDVDWFDAHPGALAHVTTLRDGEIRQDGEIIGFLRHSSNPDDAEALSVGEYRRSEVKNESTANRYSTEREKIAFAGGVDVDDAITAMAVYLGTGTTPYTLPVALDESPQYRNSLGTIENAETREVVASSEEYRPMAEALYGEIEPLIDYDAPLYVVVLGNRNDIKSEMGRVPPEQFKFVYNGRAFDDDYGRNSHLLGGV